MQASLRSYSVSKDGYTAISSLLVITAVMLIISVGITLVSIDELQSSLSISQSDQVSYLADSCVEESLLYLNLNDALPATISLPGATCEISSVSQNGNEWSFQVSVSSVQCQQSVSVMVLRDTSVQVSEWYEIEL